MRVNLFIISGEMSGLGCLLLVLLLGSLEAVGVAAQCSDCSKSTLENGYFVPEDKVYKSGEQITYACEKGYKLRAAGWWAKSECVNGKWSPEPLCIGEKDCFAKDFPNIDYSIPFTKNGRKKIIICEDGYELNSTTAAIECKNGQWISTISCIKSLTSCGEPPRVHNAVIIQRYRDIFKDNSVIQYICEDSYTMEGESQILCTGGVWESKPTCKYSPPPIPPPRPTSPSDDDEFKSRPVRECGAKPKIQDGQLETEGIYTLTYKCNDMFTLQGPQDVVCRGNGWSERPLCLRHQNPTGEREKPDKAVTECGEFPVLKNGVLVERNMRSGRYQCSEYYKLEGSNVVYCRHNGMWSKPPTCLDPCTIERLPFRRDPFRHTVYVMEGTGRYFPCEQQYPHITYYSYGFCSEGRMTYSYCVYYRN